MKNKKRKMIKLKDSLGNMFVYEKIKHKKYKYRLYKQYILQLNFIPKKIVSTKYYQFTLDGVLTIEAGYNWDGASGPTIDTKSVIRASCVHDVLYQMMREKELSLKYKDFADRELQRIMLEDSSTNPWNRFRAWYYYKAVKLFAGYACKPVK